MILDRNFQCVIRVCCVFKVSGVAMGGQAAQLDRSDHAADVERCNALGAQC